MKLFGFEEVTKRRRPHHSQLPPRSFGASNATSTSGSGASTEPSALRGGGGTRLSQRLSSFLFGTRTVQNPLGGRETNEQLMDPESGGRRGGGREHSSTSFLDEREMSSSAQEGEEEEGKGAGVMVVTENPLKAPSGPSGGGGVLSLRPSRTTPLPPLPPPTESPVSTRFLSSLTWLHLPETGSGGGGEERESGSSLRRGGGGSEGSFSSRPGGSSRGTSEQGEVDTGSIQLESSLSAVEREREARDSSSLTASSATTMQLTHL
jgi:hypothetical protein